MGRPSAWTAAASVAPLGGCAHSAAVWAVGARRWCEACRRLGCVRGVVSGLTVVGARLVRAVGARRWCAAECRRLGCARWVVSGLTVVGAGLVRGGVCG